ncbi:MAG: glycosyltransferase [Phycisphaerales bacterium JB052]
MNQTIWIPDQYTSQFGLLGAMARELREAFVAVGHDARIVPIEDMPGIESGVLLFMNTPTTIDMLPRALFEPGGRVRAIQYMVDHPFALPDEIIDRWSQRAGLGNYRLCMPCADDAHLLRARFPGLVHRWVPHGLPRGSLRSLESITAHGHAQRAFDVVVTGSVRTQESIDQQLSALPAQLAGMAREMVYLMVAEPHLGYVAAADLVMGSAGVITGDWKTLKLLWALVISMVNRARRLSTVRALQGLKVGVFGSSAWKPECVGTIEYAGEIEYARNAEAFGHGRVALAWGPSQFVHSYSERIMQAMASGACVVADDRLLVRRDFKDCCTLFDWSKPEFARQAVDRALGDAPGSVEMARRGRALVESRCLWEHRVGVMMSV